MSRANLALSPDSLIFTVLWFGSLQSYVTLFDGIRDALQWLYLNGFKRLNLKVDWDWDRIGWKSLLGGHN